MDSNIDFRTIRSYNGSQNNAFEELVCQLARLSRPENAESFIRKEGSGGDTGVKCFWKLKDDSEHAWQTKCFLGTITNQQGSKEKFTEEQMKWFRMIKEPIASSFHIENDGFSRTPFNAEGGFEERHPLFGNQMDSIMTEINEALSA